jgi:Conserved hypothetical protein (DUF2461)
MAPKKGVRKRTLSVTNTPKAAPGTPGTSKRLRTRTPAKAAAKATIKDEDDQSSEAEDSESDFEDEEEAVSEDISEEEEPTDLSDEDDYGKSGRRKSGSAKKSQKARTSTGGTKTSTLPTRSIAENGEGTGLGPGVQVITKKAKARPAGNVRYTEDTVHPNTMLFLGDLKANNRRDWLKGELSYLSVTKSCCILFIALHADRITGNDPDYRTALQDWNSFVEQLSEKITEIDDTIPELPIKDLVSTQVSIDDDC